MEAAGESMALAQCAVVEPGATGIAVGTACPVCRDVAGKLYGKHNEAILKCGKCVVFWYNVAERQDFVEQ